MARNRRHLESSHKRDDIIGVARRLMLSDGYEAVGMAHIAREAGVAPNTLYWYFDDKDALLIAVLDTLLVDALQAYQDVQQAPLARQMLWMLEQFDAAASLVTTVHGRLDVSPAIRTWHQRFHQITESLMVKRLADHGMPEAERVHGARILLFVIEGLLSHHAGDPAEREAILALLVQRITAVTESTT